MKGLQVLQNRAARCVTRMNWFTPTRKLLNQCNWLSIKQLIFYHTVLTAFKVLASQKPLYLCSRLDRGFPYRTRLASNGALRYNESQGNDSSLTYKSFINRAIRDYNRIPTELKTMKTLKTFKKKLKLWIRSNIPID